MEHAGGAQISGAQIDSGAYKAVLEAHAATVRASPLRTRFVGNRDHQLCAREALAALDASPCGPCGPDLTKPARGR